MSDASVPPRTTVRRFLKQVPQWVWVVSIAGVIFAIVSSAILAQYPDADVRFRVDLSRFLLIPVIVQIHIISALIAFSVGVWVLAGPKGRGLHKTLGWTWVVAMGTTAISSLFITGLNGNFYSWIHGLSAWTLIGLPYGIYAIRNKKMKKHAKTMTGMFLGGMIVAGLFTFLPGRFMWSLFFTI